MKWETVKLADCCVSITDGDHQAPPRADNGIPFIIISDINQFNRIDFKNARYVPTEYYEELDNKRKPQNGDILYTVKGSFGIPVYVQEDTPFVFQRDIAILKCNKKINSRFLFYVMRSKQFYQIADALAIGSAQRAITLSTLKNMEVPLPKLDEQERIVKILSAYDDLIENNQKQIKLLEEAAQRLYKEWFIDLRFPGHESTPIHDGIPEGWREKPIGKQFVTVLGGTPSRANSSYWNGTTNWINSGEINNLRIIKASELITSQAVKESATKMMPKHTTVLAITGATLGQVSYTEIETCANQSVVGIIDESQFYSVYIYLYISDRITHMIGKATGGAQQHINKDIVNAYPIVLPSEDIVKRLNQVVIPIFDKIASLLFQNQKLTEARDRLLPKLMSGEIEV